jgi:dUTP pyrophosphatase
MKVKFKKLNEGAILPKRATEGSAAYDLYVPEDIIIYKGRQIIPLGFAMEMENGYEALIDPRSGFSSRGMQGHKVESYTDEEKIMSEYVSLFTWRFDCDVIQGKIDSDYRDGVGVIVHNRDRRFLIKAGTRIAQMTFHKVESVEWEETDTLSDTERGGGFGSTGVQ